MTETPAYADVLPRNIAARRAQMRLKQQDLADRMSALGYGWIRQTVSETEAGRRRVGPDELLGLALSLDTSVSALLSPDPDVEAVALPSGFQLAAATVRRSVGRRFNDKAVRWRGNEPDFHKVPATLPGEAEDG